jgi:hypothetical protein
MSRIAVIQNGTDVSRSSWADVADCYDEAARLISDDAMTVAVEFFVDDAVEHLLAALDRDEIQCIVFATNSLTSERVERAVAKNLDRVHSYIACGGGVVLLHQWRDSLSPVLPELLCPAMATRTSLAPDPTPVHRLRRDDILLHHPIDVSMDRLRDGGFGFGPSWLFFKALDLSTLPTAYKAVLVRNDTEAVLVRTDDHVPQRVVVCTPLLDWQHNVELLANLLEWAAFGSPTRLVRIGDNVAPTKFLHSWLGMDGSAAVSSVPPQARELSVDECWLLTDPESQVEVFVVPPENLRLMQDRPEVLRFLERGGTMLTTDAATELPASRITAYVGNYTQRELARTLYAEMRAVPGWDSVESAFDLRNIVGALVLLWSDEVNRTPGAVPPSEISGLVDEILQRLSTPRHQEDVSSSIALAQTVALLGAPAGPHLDLRLVDAMLERPLAQNFDVRLQILAVRAGWRSIADPDYLREVHAALAAAAPDLGRVSPIVRVLDSIALLHQLELLAADPACVAELGALIADQLDSYAPQADVGWMSVEATADVVRGLLAILDLLGSDSEPVARRLAEHAVAGADIVRRELAKNYERNARGVAWRARLTNALVLADHYFPVGLQRLTTLRWPDSSTVNAVVSPTQRSLVEYLAAENKRLRDLQEQTAAAGDAKDGQLSTQRTAAAIGRGVATWLPTLLLIASGIVIAAAVGSSSFWGLVANVGVLVSALVTLLTLLFTGLDKVHLLAASAQPIRNGIKNVGEPLLDSLGKLKRG